MSQAPIKAVLFDAYGTLLRNEDMMLIPRRIVADHGLTVAVDEVWRAWSDLYFEAAQISPFRNLREIQREILQRLLRRYAVTSDATAYVDLFFQVTTNVVLYPDALPALDALRHLGTAIVSNADQEHLAAWKFTLPVRFVLISEVVQAYKPDPRVFRHAVERLGLLPHEVLHVGDSDVDDVLGAKAAGLRVAWVNRDGRSLRPDVPAPDFEIPDLTPLPALLQRA
jgi:2-haloalkanoic acid dehalogenase type II